MEHGQVEQAIARRSALLYLPIAIGAALLFLLVANLGEYSTVARIGGAVWVGLLSLIVAMPLVTSRVRKQWQSKES
jgi:hypothetical protein